MPAPPVPALFSVLDDGFELLLGNEVLCPLPTSLKPPPIGGDRDRTLDRAPMSDVWFSLGDGRIKPEPLVISGPAYLWQTYSDALIGIAEIERALLRADRLHFGGRLWTLLQPGSGSARADPISSTREWTLTLTLYPTGPLTASSIEVNL